MNEIDPSGSGVHVERRSVLWMPVTAVCGALLGRAASATQQADSASSAVVRASAFEPLRWNDFAARWRALAEELGGLPPDRDESYAAQLAGLVARVPRHELPQLAQPRAAREGLRAGPSFFLLPCVTVEFRMDPGATLRLHNHPPQVVLTLCVEGEARYRHLEIEGDAPPCTEIGGKLLARETRTGLLAPGRTTALTRVRDGIHGFAAGARGARLVDFTVSLTEDIETFSYVELASVPHDAQRQVYAGVWTGKS